MRTTLSNGKLTILLERRVDSGSAEQTERELFAAVESEPESVLVLDAGDLEYISSAGLRVLMKLRKQIRTPLSVIKVLPEVYDIFDVTGFTELLEVHKRLRNISAEGVNGKVYRLTQDEMIKA